MQQNFKITSTDMNVRYWTDVYQLQDIFLSRDCCCSLSSDFLCGFLWFLLSEVFKNTLVLALQWHQCKYPCIFNALYCLHTSCLCGRVCKPHFTCSCLTTASTELSLQCSFPDSYVNFVNLSSLILFSRRVCRPHSISPAADSSFWLTCSC